MHRSHLNKSIDEGGIYFTSMKLSADSQNYTGKLLCMKILSVTLIYIVDD